MHGYSSTYQSSPVFIKTRAHADGHGDFVGRSAHIFPGVKPSSAATVSSTTCRSEGAQSCACECWYVSV